MGTKGVWRLPTRAALERVLTGGAEYAVEVGVECVDDLAGHIVDLAERVEFDGQVGQGGDLHRGGHHPGFDLLPPCLELIPPTRAATLSESTRAENCSMSSTRRDRQRAEQQRPDAAALIGVGDVERDLGRGEVVVIADETGVGDDRPVDPVGHDHTKWSM